MDMANQTGGLVIGTGDLSELALGWCTYNGDQMSMYGVNASIPKSLVRYLVAYFADEAEGKGNAQLASVLRDILATPVSPELLPPSEGEISQKTEEIVGPYELHDFFLYYILRWGFAPSKVYFLARMAFSGKKAQDSDELYTDKIILRWLTVFYRRFFAQQFKRSCMPDGAKVGTVSLSPRGDWRMPSDASAQVWLRELESLEKKSE
jgi:NAD+ synthase (glutamine-hydrolysing)